MTEPWGSQERDHQPTYKARRKASVAVLCCSILGCFVTQQQIPDSCSVSSHCLLPGKPKLSPPGICLKSRHLHAGSRPAHSPQALIPTDKKQATFWGHLVGWIMRSSLFLQSLILVYLLQSEIPERDPCVSGNWVI